MRLRPHALTAALVLTLAACGDSVTFVDCPPGTLPDGANCVPIDVADTSVGADTLTPPADTAVPVDTVNPPDSDAPADTAPVDTGAADTVAAPGPVGAACQLNAQCLGGTCLDWTGGYCTLLGCGPEAACPSGSHCRSFAGNAVCLADCDSDAQCRASGQACKALPADSSGAVRSCVGVDAPGGGIGAPCADATDCAGAAACISAFPGGYCAVLGCTASSCPTDSRCVRVDGVPSCLRSCRADADCGGAPGAERRCGILDAFGGGGPVDVCISGAAEAPLGASCRTDFECEDGTCEVLGEGRCSQSNAPCNPATAATDCNGAEFCHVTSESRVGVCARPCDIGGEPCPGSAYCLAETSDPNRGICRPSCTSGSTTCNADAGFQCLFGIPVTSGGQGRYVCGRLRPRDFGASCQSGQGCLSGACVLPGAGPAGYCSTPCGDDSFCPFPGTCVAGGADRCLRACFSGADCPAGFACELAPGGARLVCVSAD